jgi:thiamine kinase-like enzyme
MGEIVFPVAAKEFTPEFLTKVISRQHPGARVDGIKLVESKAYGDGMVSTAGRVVFDLDYAPNSPPLPKRVVIKVSRDERPPHALYDTEVGFYAKIRPTLDLETPFGMGGAFDRETGAFGLILDDLRLRDVTFMNVLIDQPIDNIRAILDTLAKLHGEFWLSPRFGSDLSWVETHAKGEKYDMFNTPDRLPKIIAGLVKNIQFKREMVQRLGVTADDLFRQTRAVQRRQSTLPYTLVHGDMHVGNTYSLPTGGGGLVDWQLMVRGFFMHDVCYYLATSMSVEMRRRHERELLAYYLEKLKQAGVKDAPDFDSTWMEYRRAAVWGVYIGWLTTPVENYGWEITVMNHLRVMTAYEDLETAKAISTLI